MQSLPPRWLPAIGVTVDHSPQLPLLLGVAIRLSKSPWLGTEELQVRPGCVYLHLGLPSQPIRDPKIQTSQKPSAQWLYADLVRNTHL
jgi:hypothetical protein